MTSLTGSRVLASAAVLAFAGTYVAERVDYARRHVVGVLPAKYWPPQLVSIWLPGLGLTLFFAVAAVVLARRARRT